MQRSAGAGAFESMIDSAGAEFTPAKYWYCVAAQYSRLYPHIFLRERHLLRAKMPQRLIP